MASVAQISNLRLMVDEPDETNYTEGELSDMIDVALASGYTLNLPARDIWLQKAARFSTLVNMSEGGSSRSNGDLFARAKGMADLYSGLVTKEGKVISNTGVVIRQLTR